MNAVGFMPIELELMTLQVYMLLEEHTKIILEWEGSFNKGPY